MQKRSTRRRIPSQYVLQSVPKKERTAPEKVQPQPFTSVVGLLTETEASVIHALRLNVQAQADKPLRVRLATWRLLTEWVEDYQDDALTLHDVSRQVGPKQAPTVWAAIVSIAEQFDRLATIAAETEG